MKKLFILTAVAGSLALSSFTPVDSVAYNTNEELPYGESLVSPCTMEAITSTGTMHISTHTTINGNKISYRMHINLQDLKAVSESGAEYTGNYVYNEKINDDFNGVYEKTTRVQAILTTAGGGNNIKIAQDLHLKINAQGIVTTDISNSEVICQ